MLGLLVFGVKKGEFGTDVRAAWQIRAIGVGLREDKCDRSSASDIGYNAAESAAVLYRGAQISVLL